MKKVCLWKEVDIDNRKLEYLNKPDVGGYIYIF